MKSINTVLVEKKKDFRIEAEHLLEDLKTSLRLKKLEDLRIINRYDVSGLDKESFENVTNYILSDPVVDDVYRHNYDNTQFDFSFSREYLPGQFDQRADSAEQCIKILFKNVECKVKFSKIYLFRGKLDESDKKRIKKYLINPVDSREGRQINETIDSLKEEVEISSAIEIIDGFCNFDKEELETFHKYNDMAMSLGDLILCQEYFLNEKRDPSVTELKVIDTYWSDHCRHTTFSTELSEIYFSEDNYVNEIKSTYDDYLEDHISHNGNKPVTLMNIATLRSKIELSNENLKDLIISDEINACTIEIIVDKNGKKVPYNLLFKNETHNHPTEIEPFGGAATCLGGAIRDPLSGRAYVYQSMRISGSADPRADVEDTLPGKLPQRKITREAARGFSSYGNQIGLATGYVKEIYNEGYVAKRLECGIVIGAVPSENVKREKVKKNDLVLLIGGKTGRDGCGGATGSSKSHSIKSLEKCGAEVQKGNPLTERKLQRLFKNPEISKRIKKCNDFGAGGVSVAIGELADSLEIYLDSIRKKYLGLNGTELAISESQERMAVVISPDDLCYFNNICKEENILCDVVAKVTDSNRLIMKWNDKEIVSLSRDFLNTNGITQIQSVKVNSPDIKKFPFDFRSLDECFRELKSDLKDLSQCSQKGLIERFDSSIGRNSVLTPFGGKTQKTPSQIMASKIPVVDSETSTVSLVSYGFDPEISSWSPFHGAMLSVLESCSKIIASGANMEQIRFSFQEYFEKLKNVPEKWGKPFSALLGAYKIQKELKYPAIGGKDSMSGSFDEIDVPPTLISFAVGISDEKYIVTNELKHPGNILVCFPIIFSDNFIPDTKNILKTYKIVNDLIKDKCVFSSGVTDLSGVFTHLSKRAFGNMIGVEIFEDISDFLFTPFSIILEVDKTTAEKLKEKYETDIKIIGKTLSEETIKYKNHTYDIGSLIDEWEKPLNDIFPIYERNEIDCSEASLNREKSKMKSNILVKKGPKVFIPVFPGTNCEIDTKRAFEKVGALCTLKIFKNIRENDIEESTKIFAAEIADSQILMLPGGFSAGDEPDGSGKFISAFLRNPLIKTSIMDLLNKNDGLILGICNGFQVLLRLGLLPFGEYRVPDQDFPTLTSNKIGRHISTIVNTKVFSVKSPWLNEYDLGRTFKVPVSHSEGRFFCTEKMLRTLEMNGQIATRYCDDSGAISSEMPYNPNGSIGSVEGITSPDGKILGKMGHNERINEGLYKNIPGIIKHDIFKNGVDFFLV